MLTQSEENYLKVIYNLSGANKKIVSTNAVAEAINTKAASATDMIKNSTKKGWSITINTKGSPLL